MRPAAPGETATPTPEVTLHPAFMNKEGNPIPVEEQQALAAGWVADARYKAHSGTSTGGLEGALNELSQATTRKAEKDGVALDSVEFTNMQIASMEMASEKQIELAARKEAEAGKPSRLQKIGAAVQNVTGNKWFKRLKKYGVPVLVAAAVGVGVATTGGLALAVAVPAVLTKAGIGLVGGAAGKAATHTAGKAAEARKERQAENTEEKTRERLAAQKVEQEAAAARADNPQNVYKTALEQAVAVAEANRAARKDKITLAGVGGAAVSGAIRGTATGIVVGTGMASFGFAAPNLFGKWGFLEAKRAAGPVWAPGTSSASATATPSPKTSPSITGKPNASVSPSKAVSPSASTNPNMTPSTSPSLSPTAEMSPSGRPSLSPSAEATPTGKPSVSASASPSAELTPSGKPSVSPSTEVKPSTGPGRPFDPEINKPGRGTELPDLSADEAKVAEQTMIDQMMEETAAEGKKNVKEAAAAFEGKGKNGWAKFQNAAGEAKLSNRDTWYGIVGDGPDKGGLEGMNASGLFDIDMGGQAKMTAEGIKFRGDTWWIDSAAAKEDVYVTSADGKSTLFFDKGHKLNQDEQMAVLKLLSEKGSKMISAEDARELIDKEFNPTPTELAAQIKTNADETVAAFDQVWTDSANANPAILSPDYMPTAQQLQMKDVLTANADALRAYPESSLKYLVTQLDAKSSVPPQEIEKMLEELLKKELQLV